MKRSKAYIELEKKVLPPSVFAAIERERNAKRPPAPDWNDKATEQSRAMVKKLVALNAVWNKPERVKAFVRAA
jgi:hypothetical protein